MRIFSPLLGSILIASALLAGCSDSDDAEDGSDAYTAPRAADAPAATDVTPAGTEVPAGEWGVVRSSGGAGGTVYALRMTAVVTGAEGDLADTRGAGDLSKAIPFHVSWTWVALKGDATSPPSVGPGDDGFGAVAVPSSLRRCKPAAALDYTAGLGHEQRGCTVVTALMGSPTTMTSNGIEFQLPAAE